MSSQGTISLLEQRKIEAEILKYVYDTMAEELGEKRADLILKKAISQAARDSGAKAAAREKEKPSPRTLAAIQHLWSRGGALKLKVTELTDSVYAYEVTDCAYARMYEELGMREMGFKISCLRDAAFIEGYAPDLVMERESTIMEGAASCLFRYKKL
ncbi:MAG: L-2-amino-thiazoline-4-carboxylic acid hydrolase [Deltaproteobacteria bacterium]|jgi:predicted ArsR family transcriptional regulator|nr:L-2-amino-thiazoline-4-carboxylic acid hydrolase [Deltaproteobacteria bacterium]